MSQTPNCCICRWKRNGTSIFGKSNLCGAQGYNQVYLKYNNALCKKLYEKRKGISLTNIFKKIFKGKKNGGK